MLEHRRRQRGTAREDEVRTVRRLDAANALDDVRSNALEWTPLETFRTVRDDVLRRRVEAVRERTARRLRPEPRPHVVGATAEQQIEALAMRGEHRISTGRSPIARGPVDVGETIFARRLDH